IYITPYGQATNVYEAENAAVNHANIAAGANASGSKYAAQMDYSDSYVDFYVKVPTTKTYTMTIRYANGTGASSTQNLAYNGGAYSTVSYPATAGWGQFGTVNVNVNLTAGDNIIRLTKGNTGYAEIDNMTIN
ncbi:CBM35 domain-containing protein, partial [Paenibacillus sp. TAF58]